MSTVKKQPTGTQVPGFQRGCFREECERGAEKSDFGGRGRLTETRRGRRIKPLTEPGQTVSLPDHGVIESEDAGNRVCDCGRTKLQNGPR